MCGRTPAREPCFSQSVLMMELPDAEPGGVRTSTIRTSQFGGARTVPLWAGRSDSFAIPPLLLLSASVAMAVSLRRTI